MVEAYLVNDGHGRPFTIQDYNLVIKKMENAFPRSLVENEKRDGRIHDEYWIGEDNAISAYFIYSNEKLLMILDDGLTGKDISSKTKFKLKEVN